MANVTCDLCNSRNVRILLKRKKPSLTSDRLIVNSSLIKFECKKCGLVFSKKPLRKMVRYYTKNYSYNLSELGDNVFFTTTKKQERSKQVFDWIMDITPKENLKKCKTVIEVGCGNGNLLNKFVNKYPNKSIIGYEVNKKSIKEARKKGLDVRDIQELEKIKADIIISYAVIEHTESPKKFLKKLSERLNPDGIIIIGQPHQDKIYYDLFFVDHLFHFSSKHIQDYGKQLNLIQIKKSVGRWPVDTFSIHIFRKSKKQLKKTINFNQTKVLTSFNYYLDIFERINSFLKMVGLKTGIVVIGLGELFSIFSCYTNLKNAKIIYGMDDFPKKENDFNFKTIPLKCTKKINNKPVLITVNPKYYNIILKKIQKKQNEVFMPFQKNKLN